MPSDVFLSPYKSYSKHLITYQSVKSICLSISEHFAASWKKDQQQNLITDCYLIVDSIITSTFLIGIRSNSDIYI